MHLVLQQVVVDMDMDIYMDIEKQTNALNNDNTNSHYLILNLNSCKLY